MKTIALVNNKGGVAKTTTAINLAAGLTVCNKRVLLVDLDSQGSASLSLGFTREQLFPSSADVLIEGYPIRDAIRTTSVPGLDLLTGSMELANADVMLVHVEGRERLLQKTLAEVSNDYDFAVLDCPPSLSLLPVNALVAADEYIVPIVPHYLALEGLINLTQAIELIQKGIGVETKPLGIVLTMVDYRTKSCREIAKILRHHYREQVFDTEIKVNCRLHEAPSHGKTIFQYDWASKGAQGYRTFSTEVINRSQPGSITYGEHWEASQTGHVENTTGQDISIAENSSQGSAPQPVETGTGSAPGCGDESDSESAAERSHSLCAGSNGATAAQDGSSGQAIDAGTADPVPAQDATVGPEKEGAFYFDYRNNNGQQESSGASAFTEEDAAANTEI